MQKPDEENIIFKTAADFINNSNHSVFLTGKAGTGKTTFLKFIKENSRKNTAIVAPTGVAAINAGGTTIHSFFQIPFGPYLPENKNHFSLQNTADKNSLLGNLRINAERKEVMELLELLIIDEISMVRCDVLDAIDAILRHVRRKHSIPFGGVQVLYIGDMYQLPPVVKDEEWKILSKVYSSQYFFNSLVVLEQSPVYIELKKVYRQSDSTFINLLNQVRNNELDEDGYHLLHSRYMPEFKPLSIDNFITLTTHNNKADAINAGELATLVEKTFSFTASISGSFFDNSFPADEILRLKLGAQVMFLKNDTEKIRRYYNGKIGTVKKFDDDKIWVECVMDNSSQLIEVKRETWRNIKYALNSKTQKIEEEDFGSFTQFPLRLAWAITIHKSQGLTFDRAIIDAGKAFAPGQVYVALSRCTSLEGIVLHSKISYNSLHSDERIVDFAAKQQSNRMQEQILFAATTQYQQDIVFQLFDFKPAVHVIKEFTLFLNEHRSFGDATSTWLGAIKLQMETFDRFSEKFMVILKDFFRQELLLSENDLFQQRFKKAASWFLTEIVHTKNYLLQSPAVTDNRELANDYTRKLQKLFDIVCYRIHLLEACTNGFNLEQYSIRKNGFIKELFTVNAYSGKSAYVSSDIKYPDLYNLLKDKRNEFATEKNIAIFMVCKTQSLEEMTHYLPCTLNDLKRINGFGAVKLKQFGNEFITIIKEYCAIHDLESNMNDIIIKKAITPKSGLSAKPDTKVISFDLYKQGKSSSDIAKERNLSVTTIETHLAYFVESGELSIDKLMNKITQQTIKDVFKHTDNRSVQFLKEKIPAVSYAEIKWMIALEKRLVKTGLINSSAEIVL